MREFEFYNLQTPISLAMYDGVRTVCIRLQEEGWNVVKCIVDPTMKDFFIEEKWTVSGLRGSDREIGKCYLLMSKTLNRSKDGTLPARVASNTVETLASTEVGQ